MYLNYLFIDMPRDMLVFRSGLTTPTPWIHETFFKDRGTSMTLLQEGKKKRNVFDVLLSF